MERGLIDVDYICEGLLHEDSGDGAAELLLLVPQLLHPLVLGPVDHLRFAIARPMFQVDLSDEPGGQLW